jgi:hypothetical protein
MYLMASGLLTMRLVRSYVLKAANISDVKLSSGVKQGTVCSIGTNISEHEPSL